MTLAFTVMHEVGTVRKIDGRTFGSGKECGTIETSRDFRYLGGYL